MVALITVLNWIVLILSLLCAYVSASHLLKWFATQERGEMIAAVVFAAVAVSCFGSFVRTKKWLQKQNDN